MEVKCYDIQILKFLIVRNVQKLLDNSKEPYLVLCGDCEGVNQRSEVQCVEKFVPANFSYDLLFLWLTLCYVCFAGYERAAISGATALSVEGLS